METDAVVEAFISGARWARMATDKAFNDVLLNEDAKYYASSGGDIRCRGDGTFKYLADTARLDWMDRALRQPNTLTMEDGERKRVDTWVLATQIGGPLRDALDAMMKDASLGRFKHGH